MSDEDPTVIFSVHMKLQYHMLTDGTARVIIECTLCKFRFGNASVPEVMFTQADHLMHHAMDVIEKKKEVPSSGS